MFVTVMSPGPLMVTCMLPLRPGPNRSTVAVVPCEIVAPVLDAVLPVPRLPAFGVGLDAGDATAMSTPVVVCPPETLMIVAWPTAPPPPPLPPPPPPLEVEPPLPPPHAVTPINRGKRTSRKSAYRVADFTISSRMFG